LEAIKTTVFNEFFLNVQLHEVGLHITHVTDCLCSMTGLNPSVTWPHLVFLRAWCPAHYKAQTEYLWYKYVNLCHSIY